MKKQFIITKMNNFERNLSKYLQNNCSQDDRDKYNFFIPSYNYKTEEFQYIITDGLSIILVHGEDPSSNYKLHIIDYYLNRSCGLNHYFTDDYLIARKFYIIYNEIKSYEWDQIDFFKIKEKSSLICNKKIKINEYFSIDMNRIKDFFEMSDSNLEDMTFYMSHKMPVLKIVAEDMEIYLWN